MEGEDGEGDEEDEDDGGEQRDRGGACDVLAVLVVDVAHLPPVRVGVAIQADVADRAGRACGRRDDAKYDLFARQAFAQMSKRTANKK